MRKKISKDEWNKMSDILSKLNLTLVPIQNKGREGFWKSFQKIKSHNGMYLSSRKSEGKGKRELKKTRERH